MASDTRNQALHKIAQDSVHRVFHGKLSAEQERDLVTAIVRQWLTYEGHAALFTASDRFWLAVRANPQGGYTVTEQRNPGDPTAPFPRDWDFEAEQVPDIFHRLNLGQSAEFSNQRGQRLRLWVEPKERRLNLELLPEADSI
jgi:hypothetical protein